MKEKEQSLVGLSAYKSDEAALYRSLLLKQGKLQQSDRTNTARFIREYGDDVRYNAEWKKWLVWNGKYWQTDASTALLHERILKALDTFYDDLPRIADIRDRLELEKHIIKSESMRRREAIVKSASVTEQLNITSDDLDKNAFLVNVRNGTLDILNDEFREHRREDMITKIAPVDYDPAADCPLWRKFILEIMDYKADVIQFLQTTAGWAITGDTTAQVMFILFGSGANGKSTFLNTLLGILGDYAAAAQTQTFLRQHNNDRMSNDIACLRGARFVTTTEAEQGARLSEPLIKQITGNDKMQARFLYGEFFSFKPTFKLFMATNHKPVIKGTDYGIWRRIRLIPFTTTIPAEKQDKYLEQKLQGEASGILNWLIEGALRWHKEGLTAPADILNATDEYRQEMDVIGNFIKTCCILGNSNIKARDLFKAYQSWCSDCNEYAVNERFFSLRLKELQHTQKRMSDGLYWLGIALKPELF